MRWFSTHFAFILTISVCVSVHAANVSNPPACASQPTTSSGDDSPALSLIQKKAAVLLSNESANDAQLHASVPLSNAADEERQLKASVLQSNASAADRSHILDAMEKVLLIDATVHEMSEITELTKQKVSMGGWIAIAVFVCICVSYGLFNLIIKNLVGRALQEFIEKLAPLLLGVDVTFEKLNVSPLQGRVHIWQMVICNPKAEPPYTMPYLLSASDVILDIGMWTLLRTFTGTIHVQEFLLDGVHIVFEKPHLMSGKSNIEVVQDFIKGKKLEQLKGLKSASAKGAIPTDITLAADFVGSKATEAAGAAEGAAEDATSNAKGAAVGVAKDAVDVTKELTDADDGSAEKEDPNARKFFIHKLDVENVGAQAKISGVLTKFTLPPVQSDDFCKECKGTDLTSIILALVEKFAKSMLTGAFQGVGDQLKEAEKKLGKCCGKMCGGSK